MKKAVLITGASKGTGFAIAEKFAKEGYAVFISSRIKDEAEAAAEKIKNTYNSYALGLKMDSESKEDTEIAFAKIKESGFYLATLILNAADLGIDMPIFTTDINDWARVIYTNLVWNFQIVQNAVKIMIKNGGSIVFVGSNTSVRAIKNRSAYIASKGGINSLVRALAVELGEYGIRANCIMSGSIKTVRFDALSYEVQEEKKHRVPINDIADFEDIANAAWFLSCDMSKNITGTEVTVDGGANAQLFPNG
ncbi:MAG: SDR family oxidoreductase [Clostridia bacterium]|nr:SDR family oxidoreductase [Clostridia bacterium]